MKKLVILFSMLVLLVGCGNGGSGDLSIEVENTPTYVEGGETEIVIDVEGGDEELNDLAIDATLEMEKMDHGIIEVHFTGEGDGKYSTTANLPMAGEWVMNVTVAGEKTYQTTLKFDVK